MSNLTCSKCGGPREWVGPNTRACVSCDVKIDRPCGCRHRDHCAEMKTSQEWMEETKVKILDPDGWDRRNFFYSFHQERITRQQFDRRVAMSTTCLYRPTDQERIEALEQQLRARIGELHAELETLLTTAGGGA